MVCIEREFEIRNTAVNILKECKIDILQAISFVVILYNIKSFKINYRQENLAGLLGLTLYFEEFDEYYICTDKDVNKIFERNKFTLAHELGHIVLRHLNSAANNSLIIKNRLLEEEANIFADELLMPTMGILQTGITKAEELSKHYGVSLTAAAKKLRQYQNNALFTSYLDYLYETSGY